MWFYYRLNARVVNPEGDPSDIPGDGDSRKHRSIFGSCRSKGEHLILRFSDAALAGDNPKHQALNPEGPLSLNPTASS